MRDDPLALEALNEVGRALGIVMSACTVILNPSRFVIGGGLGLAGFDFIVPAIREEMVRRTIPNHRGQMDILPSQRRFASHWLRLSRLVCTIRKDGEEIKW